MYQKETLIPASIPLNDQSFLDSRGTFYAGGTYSLQDGKTRMTGQMYVEIYVPKAILHPYPLVFLHGAAQTGLCWMSTPDGRPGWVDYFLKKGYVAYVTDQPERGRSACHLDLDLHPNRLLFSVSDIEAQFTAPSAPLGELHTQWPGSGHPGDPAFDTFYASQVDCIIGIAETQQLVRDACAALLDMIGPAIIIGHSQAGPCVWEIGDARPDLARALIAIEPSGPPFWNIQTQKPSLDENGRPTNWGIAHLPLAFDPPISSCSELEVREIPAKAPAHRGGYLQKEPARKLVNLQNIPTLVMTAEASYHAPFDYLTFEFLKQAGVDADYLFLPDAGIRGNGHMMMLEKNSDEVASLLFHWMNDHGF